MQNSLELLEGLKTLVALQDTPLLRIELDSGQTLYGYVREVEAGHFVIDELHKERLPLCLNDDYELTHIITLKRSVPLDAIRLFCTVSIDDIEGLIQSK